MKTLIIYYSLTGNVAFVAEKLAKKLGADTLPLEVQKAYPDKGFKKFFWGGKSAVMGEKPALVQYSCDLADYEYIIFGSPVWAGTFAPPLRTFLAENAEGLKGKRVGAFLCSAGGKAGKALEKLQKAAKIERFDAQADFVDPKEQPSEEKDARILLFADELSGGAEQSGGKK